MASPLLSYYSLRGSKEYEGVPMAAYRYMDEEGVVCPPVLPIIEKGVLKNMFVSRMPATQSLNSSTGQRFSSTDLGNYLIKAENPVSYADLRAQLLTSAKKESLPYAYIVKGDGMTLRIDVETGEESYGI